jgi:multiple sugar transport system permease protein
MRWSKLSPMERREALTFYLCISPWLIGFLAFTVGPMLVSFGLSFTRWDLFTPPQFNGLSNYQDLVVDPLVAQALRVTALYTLMYVPTELVGGLLLAMLMNLRVPGIKFLRAVFYLPSVLSGVAFVVVWMWLLHPEAGLINTALGWFGIDGPRWLLNPNTALTALWMMSIWGLGRAAVIYLAGLQGIPKDLLEAAAVDGATPWQRFWQVTLPLLSPTIFFNLILSVISTFQTFTSAYVATGGTGSPLDSTLFYVLYLYRQAFVFNNMGYASALAWVLFLLILLLTLLIVRFLRQRVYYEGAQTEGGL